MKQSILYKAAVAVLLALLAWLWFWPPKSRTPVPTFMVSQDTIIVVPDLTLNADRVAITISDQVGEKLFTETFVPDSLQNGLVFEIPPSLKGTQWKIRLRQEYRKNGRLIPCGTNESDLQPGTAGPTGTPIVGVDVVVNRNTVPQPLQGTYTNVCGCTWNLMSPGVVATNQPYVRELILPAYAGTTEERYKVVVTNTASGGGTSTFILSWLNATTVQYHTSTNFTGCSLSNEAAFSINGKVLSYTTSNVYYSFKVQDLPNSQRRILFFVYPQPDSIGTPTNTGYDVQVYNTNVGTCPTVTIPG